MGSDIENINKLLADPKTFEEVASEYDSRVDCYKSLRGEAKKSLETFDEYLSFYSACLEEGPTEFVLDRLDSETARSIKNMILKSSRAGRQFPVYSADGVHHRIEQYRKLGDESVNDLVTHRGVGFTTLEHIFDNDLNEGSGGQNGSTYRLLDNLLAKTPNTSSEITAILARARCTVGAKSTHKGHPAIGVHVDRLASKLPDHYPEDNRSGSELMRAAEQLAYDDPEKVDLVQSSLVRQPNEDILRSFLYLTARDVAERYRHQGQDNPWRGELQLALRQLDCLLNLFAENMSTEREDRVRSYQNVLSGQLYSGARWRSQRDPRDLPDTNFISAGSEYIEAANQVYPYDKSRFIKYQSKALRHLANGSRERKLGPNHGWMTSKEVHDQAVEFTRGVIKSIEDDENLKQTIADTVALHNYHKHKSGAVVAFSQDEIEMASDEIDEAFECLETVQVFQPTEVLESLHNLINARNLESDNQFEKARDKYEENNHTALNLEKRIELVKIKQALDQGESDLARETAQKTFGTSSPVLTATQIATGERGESPGIHSPDLEDTFALDQKTAWRFTLSMYFASRADGMYTDLSREFLLSL